MIACKNTDRAQRPVDLSDGRQVSPGEIVDCPDDPHTADLLDSGRLTKVRYRSADEVPSGTIGAVERWVGSDKGRAQQALTAEQASPSPRSTLVDALTKIITSEES